MKESMTWLLIVLMAVPLAGCLTSQLGSQPMGLAPHESDDKSQCLRYGFPADSPAFGCGATSETP